MVTPDPSISVAVRAILSASGWPACFSILFISFVAVAIFANGTPIAFAALGFMFVTGICLAVPLIRKSLPHDAPSGSSPKRLDHSDDQCEH